MNKRLLILLTALVFTITGCSQQVPARNNSQGTTQSDSKAAALSVKDFADREVVFSTKPEKIVALSNGDVNTVYALGGTLAGRPTSKEISVKEAESAEQIGTTHSIDLEKIALLHPDIVLGNYPLNMKDIASVEGIGSKLLLTSANSVDEIKQQIKLFGQLLDKNDRASELIQDIDHKAETMKKDQPDAKPRVLIVFGAPGTYMAALPNSLSGNIAELAGAANIAADYPNLEKYPQYAQLSTERIIEANPQYVFITGHGDPKEVTAGFLKEMERNSAWNGIDAVVNHRVTVLPADLFGSNPGSRVLEAMDMLHHILNGEGQK
ncbi:ABC transporter substrate-binding protein [Paenibacillus pinihumi]|uniref:ABC transporter substrate-binding protein n=1 Tax=Paenibacillus pinihumi TaxID=669462 RepID=UPI00048B7581|nr:ABC transporter substrate-binding protein [Paenibacillus pinihumi]